MPILRPSANELLRKVRVQRKGPYVRAMLTVNGKTHNCMVRCDSPAVLAGELDRLAGTGLAGEDDELAGFFTKLKKGMKKAGKGVLKGIKAVDKVNNKLEAKVQKIVGTALPFTKPFINIHNSLSSPIHKAMATGSVKKALTAKAIKQVTKDLPANMRAASATNLTMRFKAKEDLANIAKKAVKAKVLVEAAKSAAKGKPASKAIVAAAKTAAASKAGQFYTVKFPNGKVKKVAASRVA